MLDALEDSNAFVIIPDTKELSFIMQTITLNFITEIETRIIYRHTLYITISIHILSMLTAMTNLIKMIFG